MEITKELLEDLVFKQRLPIAKIRRQLGVSSKKLKRLFTKYDINIKSCTDISKEALEEAYLVKDLDIKELEDCFNIGNSKVQRLLKKYNITKPKDQIIDKIKKSNQETYSTGIPQEKTNKTFSNNFGCHPMQTREVQEKVQSTFKEKYGCHPMQTNKDGEIWGKIYDSWNKHFGCHPMQTREVQEKVQSTFKEKYGCHPSQLPSIKKKIVESKKKNGFYKNISRAEKQCYNLLLTKFDESDISWHYFDPKRYPFECDFYIKSLDLFIEYQGYWSHYIKPFNCHDSEHRNLAQKWRELGESAISPGNKYPHYLRAYDTWTKKDPLKRQTAKNNNLNWIEFWSIKELEHWLTELDNN